MRAALLALTCAGATLSGAAAALPVEGTVVQSAQWAVGTERWTAVVSRKQIAAGIDRYQYELSLLRPRSYFAATDISSKPGYIREFVSPAANGTQDADFLTRIQNDPDALRASSPDLQHVRIVGVFDGYLVAERHEQFGDCGSSEIAFFALVEGRPEIVKRIDNRCTLEARIVRRNGVTALELDGPYYAPSHDPTTVPAECCPTIAHARTFVTKSGSHYIEQPSYFAIRSTQE